ncbi:hypothetical protein PISMIDRAFT_673139 [Pisolithus microcarpus 441]|uniref:Unplaced genomic scaffold scaffold_7, whole genome shotgun sequence n=1 Tax=Pisolithus microcarpus 441 TaxID=765257 RepID=A0A0C9ZI14_9AGAM|nr:hypothetical protein PISMIDRAFT_673139 [Pisolithus microcarpus 441]
MTIHIHTLRTSISCAKVQRSLILMTRSFPFEHTVISSSYVVRFHSCPCAIVKW